MRSAEEIRTDDSRLRLPILLFETNQLRPKTQGRTVASVRALAPYEVNLSGTQLVVGLISVLSAGGLLLWAFFRLWLFEHGQ